MIFTFFVYLSIATLYALGEVVIRAFTFFDVTDFLVLIVSRPSPRYTFQSTRERTTQMESSCTWNLVASRSCQCTRAGILSRTFLPPSS